MFLRPGHYDILYHRESEFIRQDSALSYSQSYSNQSNRTKDNLSFRKEEPRNMPTQKNYQKLFS